MGIKEYYGFFYSFGLWLPLYYTGDFLSLWLEMEGMVATPAEPWDVCFRVSIFFSGEVRDRFGIPMRLEFYEPEELMQIVSRGAKIMQLDMTDDGAMEIAKRSRGTPRIAGRLLRRVRDFALNKTVTAEIADMALTRLEVDNSGLDLMDRRYLNCIALKYAGGPVGAETLCAALSEERDTIEEIIEPYLMQLGLVMRTPRGRVLSQAGYRHLGLSCPRNMEQPDLLENLK